MNNGCISVIVSYGLQAAVTIGNFAGIRQYFASFLTNIARFDVCQKLFFNIFGLKEYIVTFPKITLM
jgi:hypothetical protein